MSAFSTQYKKAIKIGYGESDSAETVMIRNRRATVYPRLGILLGDSITQQSFGVGGFGSRLAGELTRKVDIINRGYSGYNTKHIVSVLDKIFPSEIEPERVAFMTIFLGANDACLPKTADGVQLQHVPVEEYGENLEKISRFAFEKLGVDYKKQIIISPPPVDDVAWLNSMRLKYEENVKESNRFNSAVVKYAEKSREVSEKLGTRHLPLYDIMINFEKDKECGYWKKFLNDGLHLSMPEDYEDVSGGKFVFEVLFENHVKQLTENDEEFLPSWRDLK